jgi:hypothetical protein
MPLCGAHCRTHFRWRPWTRGPPHERIGMVRPRRYTIVGIDPNDPSGERTRDLWIEQSFVEALTRSGLEARVQRLRLVPEVVRDPCLVFEGLERPSQEAGFCYAGRPSRDFPKRGIDLPAPHKKVFLVFVTASGKIFDWRWEDCDPEEPDYPEDWKNRFGRLLWTNPKL